MTEDSSMAGRSDPGGHAALQEIGVRPEPPAPSPTEPDHAAITRELQLILASQAFHSSKRSQQFLTFVVQYRLAGNQEPLKERTIGTVLFKRPANYATGDDSVVRVQAGEVRRRLEQYYKTPPVESHLRIELPLGSYVPEFRWAPGASSVAVVVETHESESLHTAHTLDPIHPVQPAALPAVTLRKRTTWPIAVVATLIALAAGLALLWLHRAKSPEFVLTQFWSPIFANSKPLLICLPKPIFYRPSASLFKRSQRNPQEFDNEVDRMNGRPHLQPDDKLTWGDMVEFSDFGVSKGDVKAAFRLSTLITRLGKDSEVRVGNDYAWDDLRNAPAILIGAFSNQWTMKATSGLHFAFAEDHGIFRLQEQGASGRSWYDELDRNSQVAVDYGLVTRLVSSGTGQFLVAVAGITAPGSEAAAEVAASPDDLEKALRTAPADWKQKNVQIVVRTQVTDAVAGPPQIVAIYVW